MLCTALESMLDPVSWCYMVACAEYCVMATLAAEGHWSLVFLLYAWVEVHRSDKLKEFGLFEYHIYF